MSSPSESAGEPSEGLGFAHGEGNSMGVLTVLQGLNASKGHRFRRSSVPQGSCRNTQPISALNSMVLSVSRMLQRIDAFRAAAVAARALALHLDGQEKQSILELAADWEALADSDEKELARTSAEAETP